MKNKIKINLFEEDFDDGWEYLRDFIYTIGSSLSKEESKNDEKLIKSYIDTALQELWSEYGDKLEISHISQWFLATGHNEEKKGLVDFGQQLKLFTEDGIFNI